MKWLRLLVLLLMLSAVGSLLGCSCGDDDDDDNDDGDDDATDDDAVDDDTTDDDAGDDDTADDDTTDDDIADDDTGDDDIVVAIDFEDYDLGALPAPWATNEFNSTAAVELVPTKEVAGKALAIHGSTVLGEWAEAYYPFAIPTQQSLSITFDLWLYPDAYFFAQFNAETSAITSIANDASAGRLYAQDWSRGKRSPSVDCGALPNDAGSTITVNVDNAAGTYSVLIDNTPTDCTDLGTMTGAGGLFTNFLFGDSYQDGEGGSILFDNIVVSYL